MVKQSAMVRNKWKIAFRGEPKCQVTSVLGIYFNNLVNFQLKKYLKCSQNRNEMLDM